MFEFVDSGLKNVIIIPSAVISFVVLTVSIIVTAYGGMLTNSGGWSGLVGIIFFAIGVLMIYITAPLGFVLLI